MSKLWQARFFTTVNHLRDLPNTTVPEIAFAGRSNAGKSTAINILCNQKGLAFASKTPGRTQHINYFSVGGAKVGQHRKDVTIVEEIQGLLVDLPGYGYAEVSGSAKLHWQKLLGDYVQRREQLAALVLIMDSRRPFTELDLQMLEWFPSGVQEEAEGGEVVLSGFAERAPSTRLSAPRRLWRDWSACH